jgi:hypothetical protein
MFVKVLMPDEKAVPAVGFQDANPLAVSGLENFNIKVVKAQGLHDGKHISLGRRLCQAFFPISGAKKPETADMPGPLISHSIEEIGDLLQGHVVVLNAGLKKVVYTEPRLPVVIDAAQNNRHAGTEIDVYNIRIILDKSLVDIYIAELLASAFLDEEIFIVHDGPSVVWISINRISP